MSDKLGPRAYGKREEMIFLGREIGEQRNYSDDVARMIDDEVRAIIDKAYVRATDVLTTYQDRLTQLAEALVAKETIEADEFAAMFADLPEPRNEPGGSPTPKLATPLGAGRQTEGDVTEGAVEEHHPVTPRATPGPSPQPA
jgi:cell division protease FtsH